MTPDPGSTLGDDWEKTIRSLPVGVPELNFDQSAPGDRILVKTKNSAYLFLWQGDGQAQLRASNPRAPSGAVQIMGCTLNLSSSIRPNRLVCGDNLEFTYREGEKRWTTSPIIKIYLLQRTS